MTKVKKNYLDLQKIDLKYASGIDFDYSTEYNCEDNGCNSDFCCRCGQIVDPHVSSVNLAKLAEHILSKFFLKKDITTINIYCMERILRHFEMYQTDRYTVNTCGGYYGEEIESININYYEKLFSAIENFISIKKTSTKIEYVLNLEYDMVLSEVSDKKWKVLSVKKDQVITGSNKHVEMVKKQDNSMYKDWSLPCGIALKKVKGYRLIDGYHRFSECKEEKVSLIVGS